MRNIEVTAWTAYVEFVQSWFADRNMRVDLGNSNTASVTRAVIVPIAKGSHISLARLGVASSVCAQTSTALSIPSAGYVLLQAVEAQEHVAVLLGWALLVRVTFL